MTQDSTPPRTRWNVRVDLERWDEWEDGVNWTYGGGDRILACFDTREEAESLIERLVEQCRKED